ncbi:CU044_5270 family protein [Actinomadura macrotermitis]|uniref:CU044_5270 family protein n=1 Tax=Actinomadura macrotermitis TaxID=2585200 RepID=A0A7K0BUK6_9ACTN|nr:CU044_5270 family protein [Actinomadura macrotermitis]MQY04885.1 hypothetical protein [Actinomadura macrotermitis]
MKDVLRTLAEARPAGLDPAAPVDAGTRQAELARAMLATHEPAKAERRRIRPAWGLGAVAAAAAVAVGAATLAGGGDGPQRTPEPGGPALNAPSLLLAAAHKLETRPDERGAYWHTKTVSAGRVQASTNGQDFVVVVRDTDEGWVPVSPTEPGWSRSQDLGVQPATPAAADAWKQAGAPRKVEVRFPVAPGNPNVKKAELPTGPSPAESQRVPPAKGGKLFWIGRNVTVKELLALPADAGRLKAVLLRDYKGHDTEAAGVPMSAERWLFTVAGSLVTDLPVRAKTRGAAFRLLAGLPGVRAIPQVTDAQGRRGTAVAMADENGGATQRRLILDPASGNALGSQTVLVRASKAYPGLAPGTVLSSVALVTTEWTNSVPRG